MKRFYICVLLVCGAIPVSAQRDFLTADEVDKVREAQDPNERLNLYLYFARQRLDQLQQLISKDKKGRSLMVRDLLEDYANIIDAIDTVSDDALKRKVDVSVGTAAVSAAEKGFLEKLKKIQDHPPQDIEMFEIALREAIDNTSDSIDLAKSDVNQRQSGLLAKEDQEKKERESILTSKEVKERNAEQQKADGGQGKRKPPTLYRKGEKPDEPNQPK
jgi:hypothetical protein